MDEAHFTPAAPDDFASLCADFDSLCARALSVLPDRTNRILASLSNVLEDMRDGDTLVASPAEMGGLMETLERLMNSQTIDWGAQHFWLGEVVELLEAVCTTDESLRFLGARVSALKAILETRAGVAEVLDDEKLLD